MREVDSERERREKKGDSERERRGESVEGGAERWCLGKRQRSTHTADNIPWVKSWKMTVSSLSVTIHCASFFFCFSFTVVQNLIHFLCLCLCN